MGLPGGLPGEAFTGMTLSSLGYVLLKKNSEDRYSICEFYHDQPEYNDSYFCTQAGSSWTFEEIHDFLYFDSTIGSRCNPDNKLPAYVAPELDYSDQDRVKEILDTLNESDVQLLREHFQQEDYWRDY